MTRVGMVCHRRQPGKEHYTLEHLVADMHALLLHLGITQAYISGHSMGGATTAGFAARHPEMVKAALICNIDGGQQPSDPMADREAAETRRRGLEFVRVRGLVDYARQQIAANTVPRFILESEAEQLRFVTRYAHQPLHGYLSVGEALPWRDTWLTAEAQPLQDAGRHLVGQRTSCIAALRCCTRSCHSRISSRSRMPRTIR